MKDWFNSLDPLQILIYGYLAILLIGFGGLCLPFMQTQSVTAIDNLFTATSALSTTGLATLSVAESYNFGGQLIILLLIQIGGLGYMSLGSFIVLLRRRRLSKRSSELIQYDFSLPENFSVFSFIQNLVLFTFAIELLGALLLMAIFWYNGESNVVWSGIFHSISAFCTAGFSLFSNGFEGYAGNFYLNAVISVLAIAGALGFIVFTDFYQRLSGRK